MHETISGYSFQPADLKSEGRAAGISAFMRIRNGEAFLEPTIRSHIDHFDESVAVYNQCTDKTPNILGRLAQEYGPRLRIYHYADRVYPPGSDGHAATAANDPASMVNYSNFAMAQTRFRTVTKLDDDHLALDGALGDAVSSIRASGGAGEALWGFSGVNLWRGPDHEGPLSVPAFEALSGSGDIGFFDMRDDRFFTHDKRFERTPRAGLRRRFIGILYWHLKYLKPGLGFANYELEANPASRFWRKREQTLGGQSLTRFDDVIASLPKGPLPGLSALLPSKQRFIAERNRAIAGEFARQSVEAAVSNTVRPDLAGTSGLT